MPRTPEKPEMTLAGETRPAAVDETALAAGQVKPVYHGLTAAQRLHRIMSEVAYVQKEDRRVNGQYTFMSFEGIVDKVRPYIVKWGILVQPELKVFNQDGNRSQVICDFHFVNVDDVADRITVPGIGLGVDPSDKGPGKAYTYAYKAALRYGLMIQTGDEDDIERDLTTQHQPALISADQVDTLADLVLDVSADLKAFCKFLKVDCLENLPAREYDRAVKALESKRTAGKQ